MSMLGGDNSSGGGKDTGRKEGALYTSTEQQSWSIGRGVSGTAAIMECWKRGSRNDHIRAITLPSVLCNRTVDLKKTPLL
jgi:hypothetical protein